MINGVIFSIKHYYSELYKILGSRFDENLDGDYYDLLCSNPSLLDEENDAFYFNQLVLKPLKVVLSCVVEKGCILVDEASLPNEYRLTVGAMLDILKAASPKCRRMMLERIKCPSGTYSDLECGFMSIDSEALQRAAERTDLTNDFKRISFLRSVVYADVKNRQLSATSLDERFYDVMLLANGRPFDERCRLFLLSGLNGDEEPANSAFATAKFLIEDCYWNNVDCFTSEERHVINEILKSPLFMPFVTDCRKEFKKAHPQAVFAEASIIDKTYQKESEDAPVAVINGVRGLAKFIGVGVTKAQEIVNSKILEENGISYWVGRKICFNGEKLAGFLASNPGALKGKKLSKKR